MPTIAEQTTGQIDERFENKFIPVTVNDAGTAIDVSAVVLGGLLVTEAAGAVTVTIPESTAAAGKVFPVGSTFTVFCSGAGGVTVAKTGSDTLTGTATIAQDGAKRVTKIKATEWVIA
jgi:hypothetical protein